MADNTTIEGALGQHRVVKRPRPVKSCLECRRRKLKCDRQLPCTQCQKPQRQCRYVGEGDVGSTSEASDTELPEQASKRHCDSLDRNGSSRRARSHSQRQSSAVPSEDYGARLDRLERILLEKHSPSTDVSGSQRPVASVLTMRELTVKGSFRTRFFGSSSTRVLVNLFDEAKEFMFSRGDPDDILQPFLIAREINKVVQDEHRKATSPIAVFVDSMTPIQKRMADVLPSKAVCDQLLQIYMSGSETIYRVLHIPSFMSQYNQYWLGNPQPECFVPQLLSILAIGYRFVGAGKGQFQNERDGIHMPTACALVRTWLDSLRGKKLVEFSTLQTEVLALMAQMVVNTQDHKSWSHLGLLVRMAMTMGLHRDPSEFAHEIPPFWAEQRRKLWATILELDIHMSMHCSLPSCVREGDFTCQPPRNLNDDELYPTMTELPPSKPIEIDTNSRMQVYAANTMLTRLKVVDLVSRADTLKDYQQVLEIGNELEQVLDDVRYVVPQRHPSDANEARRLWMTRVILDMNCRRPLLALYRPFALGGGDAPQKIMTGYLKSCMILLSYLEDVDPSTPDYPHIWHLHYLILGRDIIHASFGVCYYMKYIQRGVVHMQQSESPKSTSGLKSTELACTTASRSSMLLSLPRLRSTVEKVVETMIKRIIEIGTDMKDLVSLTVVFYTYRGEMHEAKKEVKQALKRIVDAGLQSMNISQEEISSITTTPATRQLQMMNFPPDPNIMYNNMEQYMFASSMQNTQTDDSGIWGVGFWNTFMPDQAPI